MNRTLIKIALGTDMGFDREMYRVTFRILESSDELFYEFEQFGYHWPLYGLGLEEEVLRRVYGDTAAAVLSARG